MLYEHCSLMHCALLAYYVCLFRSHRHYLENRCRIYTHVSPRSLGYDRCCPNLESCIQTKQTNPHRRRRRHNHHHHIIIALGYTPFPSFSPQLQAQSSVATGSKTDLQRHPLFYQRIAGTSSSKPHYAPPLLPFGHRLSLTEPAIKPQPLSLIPCAPMTSDACTPHT